jgi:hypothetical protein
VILNLIRVIALSAITLRLVLLQSSRTLLA